MASSVSRWAACAATLAVLASAAHAASSCAAWQGSAHSGPARASLVELYTSEGCSSCPPADAELSRLDATGRVVPLALHVTYWDSLGWRDLYAQRPFEQRQRELARANRQPTVYTPHYFVNGREALDWREQLAPALRQAAARPAAAALTLRAQATADGSRIVADVSGSAIAQADPSHWQLMLALAENGLQSSINAGENRGATLKHDQVVRRLIGPLPWPAAGMPLHTALPIDATWQRSRLTLAAFVQDPRSGEVLQAVALPLCR